MYSTAIPDVLRIQDSCKQMNLIVKNVSVELCKTRAKLSTYKEVFAMDHVVISLYRFNNNTQIGNHKPKFENISSSVWAKIDSTAHSPHFWDFAVKMSNSLAKELCQLQCKRREMTHRNANFTSHHNGWLAATYLPLPPCIYFNLQAKIWECSNVQCVKFNGHSHQCFASDGF